MSQSGNSPPYARKGTRDPNELVSDQDLRKFRVFYEHARIFSYRHLDFKYWDDNDKVNNWGKIVQPYIMMILAPDQYQPDARMKALIAKAGVAFRDLNILAEVYAQVPQHLFDTALAHKCFDLDRTVNILFDDPEHTMRTAEQTAQHYGEVSRNLE
jgi:hypothetical protein